MPISRSNLSNAERIELTEHARKYKVYPYRYRVNRAVSSVLFTKADPSNTVNYFTFTFTAQEVLPIITIAASMILTPNTSVGIFGYALSYNSVYDFSDNVTATVPDEEGAVIYQLINNGGAINDFQVFYPTDWYMERGSKLYVHVFSDTATVTAANTTVAGHIVLGTMPTGV